MVLRWLIREEEAGAVEEETIQGGRIGSSMPPISIIMGRCIRNSHSLHPSVFLWVVFLHGDILDLFPHIHLRSLTSSRIIGMGQGKKITKETSKINLNSRERLSSKSRQRDNSLELCRKKAGWAEEC